MISCLTYAQGLAVQMLSGTSPYISAPAQHQDGSNEPFLLAGQGEIGKKGQL
jgi:hypothetical protein